MGRYTVRLDDDLDEWIEAEADGRDQSKAWVLEQAVRAAKGDESVYAPERTASERIGAHRTGAGSTTAERGDIEGRLAHLEEQIATLVDSDDDVGSDEDIAASDSSDPSAGSRTATETGGKTSSTAEAERGEEQSINEADAPTAGESPARDSDEVAECLREYIGDGPPRKTHAQEAVIRAVAYLAGADGAVETGELKDLLWAEFDEHYSTKRTMWNSVDRYLEEMPGVVKAGYGEWAFDVDSAESGVYD